ncbi:MAG: biotin/lipoate A/B protein ligase family protein [Isosphaeraceae bacterium]
MKTSSDPRAEAVPGAPRGTDRPGFFPDDRAMACHDVTLSSVIEDLALDEAMLIEADEGRGPPLVRFWEPRQYAVILGASRRLRDDVQVDACRADGVPILRRSSGGGTVVIGPGALNVTVILPETAARGLSAVDEAQRHVLDRIAASIARAGRPVHVLGHGDLAMGDRKCGGSAQRRLKRWFMVHCSILYRFPIDRIVRYLATPARQPAYRQGRAHRDFLSNLELPREALVDVLRPGDSPCAGPSPALDAPMRLLPSLLAEKYANPAWVERF